MDDFLIKLMIIGVLALAIYKVRQLLMTPKSDERKSKNLYQSILHDGCEHCGDNFSIVHSIDIPVHRYRLIIECDKCLKQYMIDHVDHKAWEHEPGKL